MAYQTMDVRPIAGSLGAEIYGADLKERDDSPMWIELRQAFLTFAGELAGAFEQGGLSDPMTHAGPPGGSGAWRAPDAPGPEPYRSGNPGYARYP